MRQSKEHILLVGSNLWYLGEGMLGPLFAVFSEQIGGDVLSISRAWACYLIVMGLCTVLIGRYSDGRVSKEKIMLLGYGLNAVLTFAYLFVQTPAHLLLVQAGLGLASALAMPTWEALYAKYEDKKHDGFSWGLFSGGADVMLGVGVLIGGVIVSHYSFSVMFVVMGCMQVLATLYQARILKT